MGVDDVEEEIGMSTLEADFMRPKGLYSIYGI